MADDKKRSGKSSAIMKMPGKPPRGMTFGKESSGESSAIMKMPGKPPRGLPFGKAVGEDKEEDYKKGGKVPKGMHMMPDGKMMKNSAHKRANKPKKMMGGGSVKGYGMARGGRACKMA